MEEIWKDIPGFPSYQVSNIGRVRSVGQWVEIRMPNGQTRDQYYPPRILAQRPNMKKGGHLTVHLGSRKLGNRKPHYVHVLVAEAFIGPRPDGMLVCHNDSNPLNNCVENLRYDTKAGNAYDMLRLGNHRNQKLMEKDVADIREQLRAGRSPKDIASDYGMTPEMIRNIRRGAAWAWSNKEVS